MIDSVIERYKKIRTAKMLNRRCAWKYAFVGLGQHSLSNLYPVLDYLHVPLKWIVVRSEEKARMIEAKYQGVKATSRLDDVLNDSEVRGVLVAATPKANFEIGRRVLENGKSLFVEKPPCLTISELETLGQLSEGNRLVIGLQKRYAPCTAELQKRLAKETVHSYSMTYRTGSYAEGDAMTDLFIHPLDLVTAIFGQAEVVGVLRNAGTIMALLNHSGVIGQVEMSTDYSWTDAHENLRVVTNRAVYEMEQMEQLSREAKGRVVMGVPMEKVFGGHIVKEQLFGRNNFVPTLVNNQVFTQGYYNEIDTFVSAVEGWGGKVLTRASDVLETYRLMEVISKR